MAAKIAALPLQEYITYKYIKIEESFCIVVIFQILLFYCSLNLINAALVSIIIPNRVVYV